eukprot:TRINITY_DN1209_c0_g1_i7.p1 TRINITY_DN1209_c0_g1~~TRINITY_DN1209_c0_g1_i7.p1  ORF type:complete len:365 (-),score=66.40 TRINITY_DN1209_c0_g1_i7:81-1175(-)
MGNALGCACTDVDTKTITKIEKERSCTDVIFIIAFMMLWGAVFAILGTATSRGGDARKLVYGQDYYGYVCGRDDAVKDKPYVAFADLYSAPDALLCIENCALTNTSDRMGFKYTSTTYLRYCLPKFASDAAKTSDDFNSVSQRSSRAIGDLYTSYGVIAGSCGIAFGLAFLYLIIVQKIAGILVWTMILLVLLGGAFVSASLLKYGSSDNAANANKDAMYALGIVCAVLTFLYFCLVVFLRDRITYVFQLVIYLYIFIYLYIYIYLYGCRLCRPHLPLLLSRRLLARPYHVRVSSSSPLFIYIFLCVLTMLRTVPSPPSSTSVSSSCSTASYPSFHLSSLPILAIYPRYLSSLSILAIYPRYTL